MKVNQPIYYHDTKGERHTARVTEIVGVGPSNFKVLNVSYKDAKGEEVVVEEVAHQGDAEAKAGFWRLRDEKLIREVKDEAPDVEPVVSRDPAFPEPREGTTERINLAGRKRQVREQ